LAIITLKDFDIVLGAHNASATNLLVAGILSLERVTGSEDLHSVMYKGLLSHWKKTVKA